MTGLVLNVEGHPCGVDSRKGPRAIDDASRLPGRGRRGVEAGHEKGLVASRKKTANIVCRESPTASAGSIERGRAEGCRFGLQSLAPCGAFGQEYGRPFEGTVEGRILGTRAL